MLSLRKTNQNGLLHRQMSTLSCENDNLDFFYYVVTMVTNNIYRNLFESVYNTPFIGVPIFVLTLPCLKNNENPKNERRKVTEKQS